MKLPEVSAENWASCLAQVLADHRKRAEQLLASQGMRMRRLDDMFERLKRQQADGQKQPEAIAALGRQLQEELAAAATERDALAAAQARLETQRQRIAERFKAQRVAHFQGLRRRQEELRQSSLSDEDLQRRLELALEDVRHLKARNTELELEVTRRQAKDQTAAATNWEVEKRRILATMEAEFNGKDPQQQAKGLEIQEVVEATDEAIRQKDAELAALEKQLAERDAAAQLSAGSNQAGLESLDRDEIIRRERDSAARLRKDWETKLRQAEVEISLERAKLARQRTELEEKLFVAAQTAAKAAAAGPAEHPDKPVRGRWRARLGLKDDG